MADNETIKPRNKVKIIKRKVLDAYFAEKRTEKVESKESTTKNYTVKSGDDLTKIAKKKGTTVKKIIELNDDITEKNKDEIKAGQKIKLETKATKQKISFERIYKANLGDEVYVIVETHLLQDKIIGINVLQGVEKGIEEKNKAIHIQHGDKEGVYTKVKVGEYGKDDKTISNKDDFKDKAVFKIKLGYKDSKKQKTYSDALEKLTDKKTKLFLLIDAHTENDFIPIYNGRNPDKDGEPDPRTTPNYWLDMDDKWLELKKLDCCKNNLTLEIIKKIATNATDKNIKNNLNGLNLAFKDSLINTCLRRVHFLAQVIHESGSFQYTREIGVLNSSYGGFPGRGLIQLTGKTNYTNYGLFAKEDVISTLENKQKLENDPHASKSAGWFWGNNAGLNDDADNNDFIYITRIINGGFNGYNDRLKYVKNGFKELYDKCVNKKNEKPEYKFKDSKAYDDKRASFAWGLWHDPDLSKNGCTKSKVKAIEGYKRLVELTTDTFSSTNWYGIKSISNFSTIKYSEGKGEKIKYYVKVRKAAELRIKELEK